MPAARNVENRGVVVLEPHKTGVVDLPYPTLPGDDYMIVRTTAVAINPTDWKHAAGEGDWDCSDLLVGFDYAGVVEEVGPSPLRPVKKGDRVAGMAHGTNYYRKSDGAFAQYIAVKTGLHIQVPDNISDVEAATLGVATYTSAMTLYSFMQLPLPTVPAKEPFFIFIYGGSTAMGITAIQYAKLSGAKVITTSSAANVDYVRAAGADHILDYKSCDVATEVLALTGGELRFGLDCHGDEASTAIMAKSVTGADGRIATLVFTVEEQLRAATSAEVAAPLAYTTFGEDFFLGVRRKARPQDYWYANGFADMSRALLAEGKIRPPRIFLNHGGSGFEGVMVGMKHMEMGKVSGGKLVYEIESAA